MIVYDGDDDRISVGHWEGSIARTLLEDGPAYTNSVLLLQKKSSVQREYKQSSCPQSSLGSGMGPYLITRCGSIPPPVLDGRETARCI